MNQYTIYCTEEQTEKALELGAPLEYHCPNERETVYHRPTAEQILGWLEEQGLDFYTTTRGCSVVSYPDYDCIFEEHDVDRKTSTLKAIDAALAYLLNTK